MLNFLGSGGAFNTNLGNTSAYFELGTELFLIDAGEDVFHKLKAKQLFKEKTKINIFITHLHSDHTGSLSSIIFYLYYMLYKQNKYNISLYFPSASITELLRLQGVSDLFYQFYINRSDKLEIDNYPQKIEYCFSEVNHTTDLDYKGKINSFEIEFIIPDKCTFLYSGDTCEPSKKLKYPGNYDFIYHEICFIPEVKNHCFYEKLLETTHNYSLSDKAKIYLMHLDENFDQQKIEQDGFHIVTSC